jgi:hypothetical protein
MCSTTHTAAAKSAGSPAASTRSARTPPALAPITTMSCRGMAGSFDEDSAKRAIRPPANDFCYL